MKKQTLNEEINQNVHRLVLLERQYKNDPVDIELRNSLNLTRQYLSQLLYKSRIISES